MRTRILLVIACLFLLAPVSVHAEDPGLLELIGTKLLRGVANLTTGWVEIPKQIYEVSKNEGWVAGTFRGPFDGIAMFAARTMAGAYEIVSFPLPIPPGYRPMVRPEYVWQPEAPPPPETAPTSVLEPSQDASRQDSGR